MTTDLKAREDQYSKLLRLAESCCNYIAGGDDYAHEIASEIAEELQGMIRDVVAAQLKS